MAGKGRYRADEWKEFEETCEKPVKQKCIHCGIKVSSKVERLREHLKKCIKFQLKAESSSEEEIPVLVSSLNIEKHKIIPTLTSGTSSATDEKSDTSATGVEKTHPPTKKIRSSKIDNYIFKTSAGEKKIIDLQFAKLFYACNIPFSVIENNHLKKLVELMRGNSYAPPRHDISTHLLDEVYEECETLLINELKDKNVTIIQDGWSNIHNNPIIASCLHNGTKAFFVRVVDPGSEKKTAEYWADMAEKEINYCERKYQCKVVAFCSDNENKMILTRKNLENRSEEHNRGNFQEKTLITYGCAAHYLNLVENDVSPKTLLKKIVDIQRYFRNHHQPSAWLAEKGGIKPQLPNSTRWNSQNDCIDTFLKNYQKIHEICSEHKNDIEKEIIKIMNNAMLYIEAVRLQQQLRLVSTALDNFQKDNCCIGEVMHIWSTLLEADILLPYKTSLEKRYKECITPAHIVAYQAHPKHKGLKLTNEDEEIALDWLRGVNEDYIVPLMALQISDNDYYPKSMLIKSVIDGLTPSKWWKLVAKKAEKNPGPLKKDFCEFMGILNSLPASSASIERIFLTFGWVQNKLRNRLGNEKAEKLVKCHQLLKNVVAEDW